MTSVAGTWWAYEYTATLFVSSHYVGVPEPGNIGPDRTDDSNAPGTGAPWSKCGECALERVGNFYPAAVYRLILLGSTFTLVRTLLGTPRGLLLELLLTRLHLRVLVCNTVRCILLEHSCLDGDENRLLKGASFALVIRPITTCTVHGAASLSSVNVSLV